MKPDNNGGMTSLLVGCPIYDRSWSVPYYFGHVEMACAQADIIPRYLFVGDPRDNPTQQMISDYTKNLHRDCHAIWAEETPHLYHREWTEPRIRRMVYLRNELLKGVRQIAPDYFLSVDSDIFLHVDAIEKLIQTCENFDFDAVGGKTFMTTSGMMCPSYAYLGPSEELIREDSNSVLAVDVIMAIKLMTPRAYNINYEFHHHGEDIGWSKAARAAGLSLGWTGLVSSKHVLEPEQLHELDSRIGF
jgi:hypothetical protein